MVRAPCCDKMGLKKGPWTPEEDQILIAYVQQHGHPNWRALPKKAGLLRCGKSCRLRWINYLRPDIKRGNFSTEEEETIIKLHEQLGNKWSAMAAKLPGRTDNEIKNVWHTHLKKRLKPYQKPDSKSKTKSKSNIKCEPSANSIITSQSESGNSTSNVPQISETTPMSPQLSSSSSEVSSISTAHVTTANSGDHQNKVHIKAENIASDFPEIYDSFWSDPAICSVDHMMELQPDYGYSQNLDDAMEFWYDLFFIASGEQELITDFV